MTYTSFGSFSGPWFEVTTPEQARLLSDEVALRHLKPFLGRRRSVSAAAREIGVSTERMMYRVRQFLHAGLLHPDGEVRRPGRAMRLYRAAGGLRVPFALTPFEDLEAQVTRHARPYDRLRNRASARSLRALPDQARLIYRDEVTGDIHHETSLPGPEIRQTVTGGDFVGVAWLTPEEARRVQNLMDALLRRLGGWEARREGSVPYLIQGALLRLDPENPAEFTTPPA